MTTKDGAALRQLSTLFTSERSASLRTGNCWSGFRPVGGGCRIGFRGPGRAAWANGPARLSCPATRSSRRTGRIPGHVSDLDQESHGLWVRDSLGPWLHQVAFRTAACARSAAARRQRHERRAAEAATNVDRSEDRSSSELEKALHEEIDRLPECYRVPIVLCDLQGYTCEEAARRMGRSVGTVKSWRFRGT